jgi:hypothetical protein
MRNPTLIAAFLLSLAHAAFANVIVPPPTGVAISGDVSITPLGVSTVNNIQGTGVGAPTGTAGSAVILATSPQFTQYVGIGTAASSAAGLNVYTNSTASGLLLGNWAGPSNYNGISLNGSLASGQANFYSGNGDKNLYIDRPSGQKIYVRENASTQDVIFPGTGAVGIGTQTLRNSVLLDVNGGLNISSATMINSSTTFTNGAAAQTGTLTNAPAAGNPTKWIPINDNGTTRYIPAW